MYSTLFDNCTYYLFIEYYKYAVKTIHLILYVHILFVYFNNKNIYWIMNLFNKQHFHQYFHYIKVTRFKFIDLSTN